MDKERIGKIGSESWMATGDYLREALVLEALRNGDDRFVREVISKAGNPENVLPDPKAFELLERRFPGSLNNVLILAEKIQERSHKNLDRL